MSWLVARNLVVDFKKVRAVDGVSLELARGESVGLVGESGSGKSTLGKVLMRLIDPSSGSIHFDGAELTTLNAASMRPFRRRMQMIFQDPYGSLNPRATVGAMIGEAIRFHEIVPAVETEKEIDRLLDLVGLRPDAKKKYPHELSGGQRQRIGIARAVAVRPEVIIADEPVSALDVSIRAQVLNLLMELRDSLKLTLLLISHDLSVVEHACDRVLVMYRGRIVEELPAASLEKSARDPFTLKLLAARPRISGASPSIDT